MSQNRRCSSVASEFTCGARGVRLYEDETKLNQPPANDQQSASPQRPPAWRRPPGVAPGTWEYVHQRSIADHYDAFVADTPLCRLDMEIVERALGDAGDSTNSTILDLGCGSGRIAMELLRRGHHVVGVDLSQRMLELWVEKSVAAGFAQRVLPLRANLVELQCLADASVDHAVCMFSSLGMIQGRANRRQVLRHTQRVTRAGGRLILHVHHRWAAIWEPGGIGSLSRSGWGSMTRRDVDFGDSTYAYRGLSQMFLHRFSRREIHADLRLTGWTIDNTLAISLDGSRVLESTLAARFRAGGFFVIASKA